MQTRRWALLVLLWLVLLCAGMAGDRPVATAIHHAGIDAFFFDAKHHTRWFTSVLKFPGTFWFTLCIVGGLVGSKQIGPRQAIFILLAGVISGINWLIKWTVGRMRPFKFPGSDQPDPFRLQPFSNGLWGLFHQKDLSFPSGHSCTAFALAIAVALVRPKWAAMFFILACMVAAERVLENAHYLSDVVAGAGVGAGGALVVYWIMKQPAQNDGPVFPTAAKPRS
jgi:membrane-associated phospholipid phosphatase